MPTRRSRPCEPCLCPGRDLAGVSSSTMVPFEDEASLLAALAAAEAEAEAEAEAVVIYLTSNYQAPLGTSLSEAAKDRVSAFRGRQQSGGSGSSVSRSPPLLLAVAGHWGSHRALGAGQVLVVEDNPYDLLGLGLDEAAATALPTTIYQRPPTPGQVWYIDRAGVA
jgi:hypothetical protein